VKSKGTRIFYKGAKVELQTGSMGIIFVKV